MEPVSQVKSSFRQLSNFVLIVLVLAAVVLGYFLYQRMGESTSDSVTETQTQNQTQTGVEMTNDERAVLNYPSAGVTPEEWTNYLTLVAKVAVETDTITIGASCSVEPVVLRTSLAAGKKVRVKNNDSVTHTLSFNNPPTYEVPAKGTIEMPVDFKGKPGMYGYGCDNSPTAVGFIQVLP